MRYEPARRSQHLSTRFDARLGRTQRRLHDIFVSPEVLTELSRPTYPLRDAAIQMLVDVPVLQIDGEVTAFGEVLVRERVMPSPLSGDALHVAVATVRRMQFILSWNVRHLANPNKRTHLRTICEREGYNAPEIVTPDLLWEFV
jgi:hypothetical protein